MSNQPHQINSFRLRHTAQGISVICACCDSPFARINVDAQKLVVSSKHNGTQTHTNGLTVEDLRQILAILENSVYSSQKAA